MDAIFGSSAFGVVHTDFRVLVHEATNVPSWCRTLVVSWKKGVKCVSTEPAPVQRGRAEWNQPLNVSCALCRVTKSGQVQVQAKFCWLQVFSEDSPLGHDWLNLADVCDGQVHNRTLQIWKVAFFFWRVAFQRSGSGSGRD
ncbi:unnamed protein product [Effrenium voratum]|uniref:C2 NT-type domain-containing protein n=1 Tax=Effrenium voratum TaxID=2562239 RepID=A0AA36IN52_9DINO|nr:unnamed protein product [Effrenium voratum]